MASLNLLGVKLGWVGFMPFLARCRNCNKLLWCQTKAFLMRSISIHGYKHHSDFIVMVITQELYTMLEANAHNPNFWKTFNEARKIP